jgi:hypothetical protein
MSEANLEHALHFGEGDLQANRDGRLSSSQRARLWGQDWFKLLTGTLCLVAGAAFQVGVLEGWTHVQGRGAALGFAVIAVGLMVLAISALQSLDLMSGKVSVEDGELHWAGSSLLYQLVINGVTFNVPKTVYDTVNKGHWRIYYLHRSQTVVSMEPSQPGSSSHQAR